MKKTTKQTFKIYAQHVKPYWLLASFVVLGVLGGVVVESIVPLYYKEFFDLLAGGYSESVRDELVRILVIVFGFHGLAWLAYRVAIYSNTHMAARIMVDLANTCFDFLHKHSQQFFINRFVGSLVRRVNRFVSAFDSISDRIIWDIVPMSVRIVVILGILFYHNTVIGYIILGWTIFYVVVNYFFSIYKLKYDTERAKTDAQVTGQLADTVTNNVNIKLFSALGVESRAFRRLTQKWFKIRRLTWNLGASIEAVQALLMIFLEFAIFYYAIEFWGQGLMTIGGFVLIQAYLLQIFHRLWDFGRVVREMYERLADAEEMTEIFDTPHGVQDKPRAGRLAVKGGLIEYKDVTFSYTKTRNILRKFNLTIEPGEKVGLVGPSGSGKSTLTSLLFRFYDLGGGKILLDGVNVADVTQDSLRKNMSYVPQDPILFHRTLKENIRYGRPGATDKEVARAAKLAHCDEFIRKLPEGYNTYVGERGVKLSGGERQRVAIARAILKDAPILVLDEATSSLDSHAESLIQDALDKLMKGKTTIIVAHRLSTIMKMDRIVVMKNGKIVEEGKHDALRKKRDGLYKKLWDLQAGDFIG